MTRRLGFRALGLALVCGVATAACSDDRASVTEPVDRVYNSRLATAAANLPRGTVLQVRDADLADRGLLIDIRGLESLQTGTYSVWLATQATSGAELTNVVPATGELVRVTTDTTFNELGDPEPVVTTTVVGAAASSFSEAGAPRVRHELTVTSASLAAAGAAQTDPNAYNLVFVTIEPGAPGATPTATAPTPLWARLGPVAGEEDVEEDMRFGNFAVDPADEYIFSAIGRGLIGVRGNILVVDDSALSRPPEGFYYATVLGRQVPVADSLEARFINLGPQKAPFPRRGVSLFDADIDASIDDVVLTDPPSIAAASERVRIDTVANGVLAGAESQPFRLYNNVFVTLEAKQGVAATSQSVVLAAAFPEIVSVPPEN